MDFCELIFLEQALVRLLCLYSGYALDLGDCTRIPGDILHGQSYADFFHDFCSVDFLYACSDAGGEAGYPLHTLCIRDCHA